MDLLGKGRCLTKIVTKKLREGKTFQEAQFYFVSIL